MTKEREFIVGEHMTKDKCMVCSKHLKVDEKIVLVPLQLVKKGWGNVISIPIHIKCRWVKND